MRARASKTCLPLPSQDLTTILKPGYAPVEQNSGSVHPHKGACADLYALGAARAVAAIAWYAFDGTRVLSALAPGMHANRFGRW